MLFFRLFAFNFYLLFLNFLFDWLKLFLFNRFLFSFLNFFLNFFFFLILPLFDFRFWTWFVVIVWAGIRFFLFGLFVIRDNKIVSLFGGKLILIDMVGIHSFDFFYNSLEFDSVIWIFLEHHFGLVIFLLLFFLLFEFLEFQSFSFFSFFTFLLFSSLYLFHSLSLLLLSSLLLFWIQCQFVRGTSRSENVLKHDKKITTSDSDYITCLLRFWLIIKIFIYTSLFLIYKN